MTIVVIARYDILSLIKEPANVIINDTGCMRDVLKHLGMKKIPKLYPGEKIKVFFYLDAGSSFTAKKTRCNVEEVLKNIEPVTISNSEMYAKFIFVGCLD